MTTPDDGIPAETPTRPDSPAAILSSGLQVAIRALAAGDECVDSYQPLGLEGCTWLVAQGKRAVGRYLENLTLAEVALILRSGLGLLPLSECAGPGWVPYAAAGTARGQQIVRRARALSLPKGLPIVIDYEGPAQDTTPEDAAGWLNACAAELVADGRPAELYVGFGAILSGVQLAALPQVTRYYASSPHSPMLPVGYCLVQYAWNAKCGPGLLVDLDRVQADQHDPPRVPLAMFGAASMPPPPPLAPEVA